MSLSTINASRQDYSKRLKDVMGRLKISKHQNIYDADFEYGKQPMRWEEFTANGGAITHLAGAGGCAMFIPSGASNPSALTIRQSRPYHRYQPGKGMFMATAVNFGAPSSDQYQRVGFFDDSNGIFFEQGPASTGNPAGIKCVIRSDSNFYPNGTASSTAIRDVKVDFTNWSDPHGIKNQIDWNLIQMLWLEYAWYGAGCLRWGLLINGEPFILHEIGAGNNSVYGGGVIGTAAGVSPWSRTGNLPVRYEQRNTSTSAAAATMYHYGVSVIVEGEYDEQRGFTYSYGMNSAVPRRYITPNATRFPVLSIQARTMGTQEFSNIGGPAVAQATIQAATTTQLQVANTAYFLPPVQTFTVVGSTSTITFKKQHGLPVASGNSVVLTGWTGVSNATYAYTYVSPSSITITNSTIPSFPYGKISSTGVVWDTNQWVGRSVYYLGTDLKYYVGKITSSGSTTINFCDGQYIESTKALTIAPNLGSAVTVTTFTAGSPIIKVGAGTFTVGALISSIYLPQSTKIVEIINATTVLLNNPANTTVLTSSTAYTNQYFVIGQVNRGQLLPKSLVVSSDALCIVELIATAPDNPPVLTGSDFQPLAQLGSANSFATRDVDSTALISTSGEVVYAQTTPNGGVGLQNIDLTDFFPLFNSISGSSPDILTLAVSTRATNVAGGQTSSINCKSLIFAATTTTGLFVFTLTPAAAAGLIVGMNISSGTTWVSGTKITKIFTDTVASPNLVYVTTSNAASTTGLINVFATFSIVSYREAHGLSVGDQITFSSFTPTSLNGTYPVLQVNDSLDVVVSHPLGVTSPTILGDSSFAVGANVGAHLICQEAMS